MTPNFKGRMGGAPPPKPRTVRIYLKAPLKLRGTEEGARYEPQQRLSTKCSCGTMLHFYTTYPNEKHMPFDREPRVLEQQARDDGAVIATVSADDTHFTSCKDLVRKERPTHGFSNRA